MEKPVTVAAPVLKKCLICKQSVEPGDEQYCATRKTDGGLVCPECLVKVRRGHTDTLQRLAESGAVW